MNILDNVTIKNTEEVVSKIIKLNHPKVEKENLYATYDNFAYQYADIVIVDINLDVQKKSLDDHGLASFDVDLSGFKSAIRDIGQNCKEKVLILIETTVPPGTTKIASEIIEREYLKRGLSFDNVSIGHSYERVMPGPNYIDSIQNFYKWEAHACQKSL